MENFKFNVDGRTLAYYELTDSQLVELIENENTTEEERKFLTEKLIQNYKYKLCPKNGENDDDVFFNFFSSFVNGRMHSKKHVAERMSKDHRYLQSEMFKLCLEYIKILAENADKGYYDPRNEWACKTSKLMIDHLKSIDWYI